MYELLPVRALRTDTDRPIRWLWDGFLAEGMITLLTSRWKAGKTTLVSHLFRQLEKGGALAGGAVEPGRAAIVSEEPRVLWLERDRHEPFGPHVLFCCRPFPTRPSPDQWEEIIDQLAASDCQLVVFDPLAMFLPGAAESNSITMLKALDPLHRLTERGKAVLLVHHPRKSGPADALSPRGSGALTSFADILLELDRPKDMRDRARVRRIRAASRLRDAGAVLMELDEEGRQYHVIHAAAEPDSFETGWPEVETILRDAPHRLSRSDILHEWHEDVDKPSLPTLRRWLQRARQEGRVEQIGTGRNCDPFRYGLPGLNYLPELIPLQDYKDKKIEDRLLMLKADAMAAKDTWKDACHAAKQARKQKSQAENLD